MGASWKGRLRRRFRWTRLRFEWGRECYRTNWAGDCTGIWWEWEAEATERWRNDAAKEADAERGRAAGGRA